jgi:hypothetical protein
MYHEHLYSPDWLGMMPVVPENVVPLPYTVALNGTRVPSAAVTNAVLAKSALALMRPRVNDTAGALEPEDPDPNTPKAKRLI